MSIDTLFNRKYDAARYNCAHLVAEAWEAETGVDIAHKLQGLLLPPGDRRVILSDLRQIRRVACPVTPCLVVLQSGRKSAPHVGIFLRGKVLHIKREGVEYQPLEVVRQGYNRVRFYTC